MINVTSKFENGWWYGSIHAKAVILPREEEEEDEEEEEEGLAEDRKNLDNKQKELENTDENGKE